MASASSEIVNPNKALAIPQWLNAIYFQKIIEKHEPNFAKITKFEPVAAIPPGENFTSTMLRVHVQMEMKDGSRIQKSYVLKTMLEGEGGKALKVFALFPKETRMYQTYLPAFEELYREAGLEVQLAPHCLHIEVQDERIDMIFEDLQTKNFHNLDRTKGLNMTEMQVVLRKIAEYHAASAVYAEKHGPYPEQFKNGFVCLEAEEFQKASYETRLLSHLEAMQTWCQSEEEKMFIQKMPSVEQYWKSCLSTLKPIEADFNVLTHGDFWSSNIMFRSNEDQTVKDAILVDFQLCKWGSPCEDLQFFIVVSAAPDIRFKEYDTFVQIYHEHLVKCLKALKYQKPIPKLRDLHMAMYKENVTFYVFFGLVNHLPTVLWPKDDNCSIANLMRRDEEGRRLRLKQNTSPQFIASAREVLAFYHKKGIFDFSDFD